MVEPVGGNESEKQLEAIKFSLDELATVRLLQVYAYGKDLLAPLDLEVDNTEFLGEITERKTEALAELVQATADWAAAIELPPNLWGLAELDVDDSLIPKVSRMIESQGAHIAAGSLDSILLEAAVSTDWPKGTGWLVPKTGALAEAGSMLGHDVDEEHVAGLARAHKRAFKRLRKDSIAPGAQVGLGAFIAVGFMLTGGASEAVGTAIGTHILGYSGAAATSAGLALLGGGSLAAGGFGMAGGALLVGVVAHGTVSASRSVLASTVARQSSSAFIHELAKLHVLYELDPSAQPDLLNSLQQLHTNLREDWLQLRPDPAQRRAKIWDHLMSIADDPAAFSDAAKRVRAELPPKEERSLASSVRALEYEIRYLEAPEWERAASTVTRTFGMPAVGKKLFDFLKEQ